MSALAYLVRLLRILLAAGLFATVLFGEASRSQAAICLPSTVKNGARALLCRPRRNSSAPGGFSR